MAKFKPREWYVEAEGGFNPATFKKLSLSGLSCIYSKNQHGINITVKKKKDMPKRKKKHKQWLRYQYMECMWKLMSEGQRKKFKQFCQKHNYFNLKTRSPRNVFFYLGFKYRLHEFLKQELNTQIKISLNKITEDYVEIIITTTGEITDWENLLAQRGLIY